MSKSPDELTARLWDQKLRNRRQRAEPFDEPGAALWIQELGDDLEMTERRCDLPKSRIIGGIYLNLITAALGLITDSHQAIVFKYNDGVVDFTTYLSESNEDILYDAQDIADELWALISDGSIHVHSSVVVGFQGVLKLSPGDEIFFIKKGFEFLLPPEE
ncbi:hypothetical protein [Deinococcus frigens]|uniref:hypothetical protein n=1 Tax=Deinococcus frigens TaxID=249403 RepID=UPI0012EC69BC|nr:hypothetical protein [Deinococcus frigens]